MQRSSKFILISFWKPAHLPSRNVICSISDSVTSINRWPMGLNGHLSITYDIQYQSLVALTNNWNQKDRMMIVLNSEVHNSPDGHALQTYMYYMARTNNISLFVEWRGPWQNDHGLGSCHTVCSYVYICLGENKLACDILTKNKAESRDYL